MSLPAFVVGDGESQFVGVDAGEGDVVVEAVEVRLAGFEPHLFVEVDCAGDVGAARAQGGAQAGDVVEGGFFLQRILGGVVVVVAGHELPSAFL